ncbi:ABC transporter permease [Chitinasiproducens palmae]|uniref:NitT/TauT family transport system permease protein n=1 Tax=Chitinasiproducens palmae TaxID=1770053 RepID=A0A1H2PQ08_9BURK|nr:ABC transporter permease [Chitinasiproducens palmae]SDV48044.1 NitT/TauT family transport system permease protein [Chitinasiproducens palmae]
MNERIKSVVYPLILFALILALWSFATSRFGIPTYILPPLSGVVAALRHGFVEGAYWGDFLYTLTSVVSGYAAGCTCAFVLGCLFAEFRPVERVLHPFVLALQSMPKVALAPLILVWFGFDLASKVVMVALVCFFPMFINTVVGLKATPPALIDLMRAFSASRWQILLRIKIPSAAGHIFAGLQISIVLGLIGAIVAEFVSSTKGLGFLINSATAQMDTSTMFAALASLAVLGIAGSQLVRWLHRRIVFWDRAASQTTLSE